MHPALPPLSSEGEAGSVASALTETEFRAALNDAGFQDIEIRETHRVHEHAAMAIIRARKPLD